MKGYKGFNKNLKCRDKQYEIGKEFKEAEANICKCGIQFCENPLDILDYYPLIDKNGDMNRFAEVEALDTAFTDDNKKYCTKKIKIGAELNIKDFIKTSFDFLWKNSKTISDSGRFIQIATSRDDSQVATSGNESKIATSGNESQVATSGDCSKVATSGDESQVATSGDCSKVATSGDESQVVTSGDFSQVATSGNNSQVATSGDYSQVATSGDYSKVATSGDDSQVATSGNESQVVTSGDYSQVASSGHYSKVVIKGKNSVGANIGINGIIKGVKGAWITLAEYVFDDESCRNTCVCVKSAQIDGKILKENTFYKLENGEFVEVKKIKIKMQKN